MELLEPQPWLFVFTFLTFGVWIAGIIYTIFVIWKRDDFTQATKITWALFFLIMPLLAFLGYAVFGRKKETV